MVNTIAISTLKLMVILTIRERMRIKPNSSGTGQSRQAAVFPAGSVDGTRLARQAGFTLLEVMVVMIIMSIMAAVAVPAFSSWREKQAVRNAAQSLLAQMKQARVLAVSENRGVSITFTSTSYVFDADTTGSCTTCKQELNNLSQYSGKLSVSPTTTRTFSSRGTSNSGSITLTAGSYSKTITMNVIGRAYLQ